MNMQLQQSFEDRQMPQWLYRQALFMTLLAKLAMALVFGILFLGVLLIT